MIEASFLAVRRTQFRYLATVWLVALYHRSNQQQKSCLYPFTFTKGFIISDLQPRVSLVQTLRTGFTREAVTLIAHKSPCIHHAYKNGNFCEQIIINRAQL